MRVVREITLTDIRCCVCDLTFAVPDYWHDNRRQDGQGFSCPNGHSLSFKDSENARLKRDLERARARETHLRDQRDAAERSASAHKGQATKLRKRVANGVCPDCNRSFQNVARHMASKHPEAAE